MKLLHSASSRSTEHPPEPLHATISTGRHPDWGFKPRRPKQAGLDELMSSQYQRCTRQISKANKLLSIWNQPDHARVGKSGWLPVLEAELLGGGQLQVHTLKTALALLEGRLKWIRDDVIHGIPLLHRPLCLPLCMAALVMSVHARKSTCTLAHKR